VSEPVLGIAPLVLVADPPWKFGDSLGKRGAAHNYACLTPFEIHKEIAAVLRHWEQFRPDRNAVLFFWRVAAMQFEAINIVRDLDFCVKAELVWEKLTSTGAPHFGMGRYVRNSHETCLIAVRGSAPPDVHNVRSRFSAPVREHSRKPEEFYRIVDRMYPRSRKVELFARAARLGWVQHGLELDKFKAG
jgi:N6-adenosine-specific RNA methylase IME4